MFVGLKFGDHGGFSVGRADISLKWNFDLLFIIAVSRCTRKSIWLRHYVTNRKVVRSIPDEVIGFFS
jgi:hypothetical protein